MDDINVLKIFRKYFNLLMEMRDLKENPDKEPNEEVLSLFDEGPIRVRIGSTKLGILIVMQNIIMVLGEETLHITDPTKAPYIAIDHKITDPIILKAYQNLKKEITL